MLAVSSTECVHYVAVSIRSELLCEVLLLALHFLLSSLVSRILLVDTYWLTLLFRIVTKVLEKKHLTWLQCSSLSISSSTIRSELNFRNTESSSNCVLDLTE